ncbi:Kazal-type serine protease inhibitor family protein [Mesorhizobium sp. 10J20-29]
MPEVATAQEPCGGLQGLQCPSSAYCKYEPDAQCGAADQTGVCQPRPEVCTDQYDPVCGCDGQTYSNACYAAREGVSVASTGECAPAQPPVEKPKKDKKEKKQKGKPAKEDPA